MVLAVLNSDPSLCHQESFSAEKFFVVAPQNLKPSNRRSRAHNIPGGIKHLLSDPKRRRRISVRSTALPFSTAPQPFSHRSHPRLRSTRLHHHHKAANRVAQKTLSASATPASETQNPPSPSQPQSHASTVPIDVTFPRRLSELPHKQISPEVLASLGYTAEVPSQYIRDQMERLGPIMYQALRSTKASVSGSALPKTLTINLNGQTSMPPTHMAAIYSSAPSGSEPRRVMMYPIHQSILSLYCANLPVLASSVASPLTDSESSYEVPVVPLALPNPESFPFLTQFLYLKDAHTLFEAFLSLTPSKGIPIDLDQPARYDAFVAEYSTILAQNYTMQRLASQAAKVHGLWRNACALGISDIDLQAFFDLAWEILMKALTLSSNSSPVVIST